ncbi:hypothetical protein DCAR_0102315 [Daucus carota subsp. sativus]|uniref:Uncharacterized protein n=1 Tax=Daucus carota subsp. sativus TaxID=79200 RepID=A0A166H0P8_DAUCS|nr:hypothetical protein DCAR_0102315 [Daucus carota subsp. sativus]
MEISPKLLKFKAHFVITIFVSLVFAFLLQVAPQFITILTYFWPLFISTALFLVLILVFGKITPTEFYGDKEGEGIMEYVAGQPEYLEESETLEMKSEDF